jgi:two-component system cell cycle sensor histidine kinase/response regulator CckA
MAASPKPPLATLENADLLRAVLDAAAAGIAITAGERLLYANEALIVLLASEQTTISDHTTTLRSLLDRSHLTEDGMGQRGELVLGERDRRQTLEIYVRRLVVAGAQAEAIFLMRGATERATVSLVQAAGLTSVGRLAAGIAHEINNPLAYLLGSLEFLERELVDGEEVGGDPIRVQSIVSAVANAREGAERVRRIARDLMTFARPVAESKQLVDVEAVLDSMVNLAWNEIRHRARLVKRYSRVPAVVGDQSRLGQVFLNLIVNAAQSIDAAGHSEGAITLSTELDGDRVVVEVGDTGGGIGEDSLPHVFEPFFSTKPASKGAGLGLSICQSIVASHGGEIDVKSGGGQGATFRVSLPIADSPSGVMESSSPPPKATAAGRARILVIDDEPLLGQTLSLAFAGRHDIELTTGGRDALLRLERDRAFDLILCDLMMPDFSGSQVFEAIQRDYPELVSRFAFMTGGAFTERSQDFLERYAGRRIDKPFSIADVERLLSETRTGA